MRGSDRRSGIACPPDGNGADASAPCPFCGYRRHVEDAIAVDPEVHTPHQCFRCGRWFDGKRPVCPLCGSPGELLGEVVISGDGLYVQYRCRRCGNGFMRRIDDDSATHRE